MSVPLVLLGFYQFPSLLYVCRCKVQLWKKANQGEQKMEDLQPPDLVIWRVEK
jgi:hypothetical protein